MKSESCVCATSGHYPYLSLGAPLIRGFFFFSGDGRRDGNLGALPKTWGAHQVQEDAASGRLNAAGQWLYRLHPCPQHWDTKTGWVKCHFCFWAEKVERQLMEDFFETSTKTSRGENRCGTLYPLQVGLGPRRPLKSANPGSQRSSSQSSRSQRMTPDGMGGAWNVLVQLRNFRLGRTYIQLNLKYLKYLGMRRPTSTGMHVFVGVSIKITLRKMYLFQDVEMRFHDPANVDLEKPHSKIVFQSRTHGRIDLFFGA